MGSIVPPELSWEVQVDISAATEHMFAKKAAPVIGGNAHHSGMQSRRCYNMLCVYTRQVDHAYRMPFAMLSQVTFDSCHYTEDLCRLVMTKKCLTDW